MGGILEWLETIVAYLYENNIVLISDVKSAQLLR
jgi:hypothetical protein